MPVIALRRSALPLLALAFLALAPATHAAPVPSVLQATPASASFPDHDIYNGARTFQTFVVANPSAGPVTISGQSLSGADAGAFDIENANCQGAVLNPNDTCQLDVGFAPGSLGAKTAQLQIQDDTGELDVTLSGNGIAGTLSASPSPLDFPSAPYFYGTQTQNVNLQASFDAGVQVSSITFTGPDASLFSLAYGQNCASQLINASGNCGVGVAFSPTAPGTYHAQMVIASDSPASPLTVPITATALAGPHAQITGGTTPGDVAFGDTALGTDASRTLTLANDGDFPLQVQQIFVLTGRPQTFFVTGDGCTLQVLTPGSTCELTVHFKPGVTGAADATLLLIANGPGVSPFGLNGIGVRAPDGTALITGVPAAGQPLTCQASGFPAGASFAYQWTRDGQPIAGATGPSYMLTSADVGRAIACALHASNGSGAKDVTAASAPVTGRDLSELSESFLDPETCRFVGPARQLVLGRAPVVKVSPASPVTAWSPLRYTAQSALTLTLDGALIGRGRSVAIPPRALESFSDGWHALVIGDGPSSLSTPLFLAPCAAAVHLDGGPRETTVLRAATRTQMGNATFTLPKGLTLRPPAGRRNVQLAYQSAGRSLRSFNVRGAHGSSNGVAVVLGRRTITVSGLPAQTGVVRLSFRAGVLTGRGGIVNFFAAPNGSRPAAPSASAAAVWSSR
jgi:hypothetical protein